MVAVPRVVGNRPLLDELHLQPPPHRLVWLVPSGIGLLDGRRRQPSRVVPPRRIQPPRDARKREATRRTRKPEGTPVCAVANRRCLGAARPGMGTARLGWSSTVEAEMDWRPGRAFSPRVLLPDESWTPRRRKALSSPEPSEAQWSVRMGRSGQAGRLLATRRRCPPCLSAGHPVVTIGLAR